MYNLYNQEAKNLHHIKMIVTLYACATINVIYAKLLHTSYFQVKMGSSQNDKSVKQQHKVPMQFWFGS